MITEELITYIRGQVKKNIPKDLITSRLLQAGWRQSDIDEGLTTVMPESSAGEPSEKNRDILSNELDKYLDPYREPTSAEIKKPISLKDDSSAIQKDSPKVWTPPKVEQPVVLTNLNSPSVSGLNKETSKVKPAFNTINALEIQPKEISTTKVDLQKNPDIKSTSEQKSLPQDDTKKPKSFVYIVPEEKDENIVDIDASAKEIKKDEPLSPSLSPVLPPMVEPVEPVLPEKLSEISADTQKEEEKNKITTDVNPTITPVVQEPTTEIKPEIKLPDLPKPLFSITPETKEKIKSGITPSVVEMTKQPADKPFILKNSIFSDLSESKPPQNNVDGLPKSAMISSYAQDFSNLKKAQDNIVKQTKSTIKISKKMLIIVASVALVIIVALSIIFSSAKSSVLDFSFIKKDPKELILNSPAMIGKLSAYKVNTEIKISSPSFSNIAAGLTSGEAVSSKDRDSASLSITGSINNNNLSMYDYNTIFKSSLLKNDVKTEFISNGLNDFAIVPNLKEVLGENAPDASTISFSKGQLDLLLPEIPTNIQSEISQSNLYKIISQGLNDPIKLALSSSLKDFINNANMVDKGSEDIYGVSSSHYDINVDKVSTKKLLIVISGLFVGDLSPDSKKNLDESLGAVNIDSLEIWVGKKDNTIHQVKFTLTIPLSKVIGLDDKGIADNQVKVDWKTTYYDFNVANNIAIPKNTIKISDFAKSIHDMKIKDSLSAFGSSAQILHNAEGVFGKRPNMTGNCINPQPFSLFSPVGHVKGASGAVGDIASTIKNLLSLTSNAGYCYSTPAQWAAEFPLTNTNNSFICLDNTGKVKDLSAPISGPACK